MTVLVTGATGLVGNNVVRCLIDQGRSVRVLARASSNRRPFHGLDIEIAEGDVRDEAAVQKACKGVTGIVHAAALVHIGWQQLDEQRQINVDGTRHVADAALAAGVRMVLVSSVDALAPGSVRNPADEETPLAVKVPCGYVLTKREAEQVLLERVSSGLTASIVNPGFMLGPWDWKPSSGRMVLAVVAGTTLLAPWGGFSVCDVRDVAAAIVKALDQAPAGRRFILAGHNVRYIDLWRKIADITHGRRPWFRAGPVLQIILGSCGDLYARLSGAETDLNSAAFALARKLNYYRSDRAIAELGYRIRPLDESIQASWDWLREFGYAGL